MLHLSNSFKAFLYETENSNKISKLLVRIGQKRYCENTNLITIKDVNYLTNREDGTISFLPAGKPLVVNERGQWKKENRQNGKPAKIIKKLFVDRILKGLKDSDFEQFANQYKSANCLSGYRFELLPNKRIAEVYNMCREDGDGSLNNSCMRDMRKQTFEIYESCKQLKILVLFNPMDEVAGRCLVWQIDEDITFLDRFYVAKDAYYESFLYYADKNKFWRKESYKTYDNKTNWINPHTEENQVMYATIETNTDCCEFPYIDTFSFGDDGFLTNSNSNWQYEYNNTDGAREDNEREEEEEEENTVYLERYGYSVDEDDAIYCDCGQWQDTYIRLEDYININDSIWHMDDDAIIKIGCTYYEKDSGDIIFCERDNEYYLAYECVFCEDDEEDCLRGDCIEINNKWYHTGSDLLIVDIDSEYRLKSECIEFINDTFINGVWVHENFIHCTYDDDGTKEIWAILGTTQYYFEKVSGVKNLHYMPLIKPQLIG